MSGLLLGESLHTAHVGTISQWEPGAPVVEKLQVQLAKWFCSTCWERTSCCNNRRRWLSSLGTFLSSASLNNHLRCDLSTGDALQPPPIITELHLPTTKRSCEPVCRRSRQSDSISACWSGVTFYRKKYLWVTWDGMRPVVSYRKIQWHPSLGSSFTIALGGGQKIVVVGLSFLQACLEMMYHLPLHNPLLYSAHPIIHAVHPNQLQAYNLPSSLNRAPQEHAEQTRWLELKSLCPPNQQ